jgi:serine/threonine protein kinase
MWGSLEHKFVLPFLGIYGFEDGKESRFSLVSPYMSNGTLAQWRKKVNPSMSEIEHRVRLCYLSLSVDAHSLFWKILEVSQGIEYIHSEGVVHGDLRGVSYRKRT